MNQRLTIYRRIAAVRSEEELARLLEEARDRYGPLPVSIENLAEYAVIRLLADRIGIESIDRESQMVVIKFRPEAKLDPTWLFKIVQERRDVQLTPPATLRMDLRQVPSRPRDPLAPRSSLLAPRAQSWWTARATAGEVTGGFSREEILRPEKEDPRAEGGVFNRVSGLLRDLSEGVSIR
jgi:transcription-repair coupling factor (superfamily II helicase)